MERTETTGEPRKGDRTTPAEDHVDVDRRRLLKASAVTASFAAAGGVPGTVTARSTEWDDLTLNEQLNVVRDATQPYKRLEAMAEAGYESAPIQLLCGMGYHFDNLDNWDDTLDPRNPESLFYVLNDGGTLKLGGAELILPTERDENDDPVDSMPDLFNDEDESFDGDPLRGTSEEDGWELVDDPASGTTLWSLHVWVHERNPEGVFHPHNPQFEDMPGCGTLE